VPACVCACVRTGGQACNNRLYTIWHIWTCAPFSAAPDKYALKKFGDHNVFCRWLLPAAWASADGVPCAVTKVLDFTVGKTVNGATFAEQ
jgi:hypothetical protein